MNFINTLDQLDDDIVFKSIVEGTITEFKDDFLTSLRRYAFYQCKELETVSLPNVTEVGSECFQGCEKLKAFYTPNLSVISSECFGRCLSLTRIDLPITNDIGANAFNGCEALNTVILRRSNQAGLSNINAFTNTPIANGTGYIYVPRNLVDRYKSATNWSTFVNQLRAIEDYPDICG